jgi:hypothetical protein
MLTVGEHAVGGGGLDGARRCRRLGGADGELGDEHGTDDDKRGDAPCR